MLFNKQIDSVNLPRHELVYVSLKTLIDLAKLAGSLNLHHTQLRSRQSGGYITF